MRGLESLLLTILVLVMALWLLPSLYQGLTNPYTRMGETLTEAVR